VLRKSKKNSTEKPAAKRHLVVYFS